MGHLGRAARRIDRQFRRAEAREPEGARRNGSLEHGLRRLRQLARKDRRLRLAVEDVVPASGMPATARKVSRPSRMLVSRVARTEASATVPTLAPAASVRREARFTRRRRIASSRS